METPEGLVSRNVRDLRDQRRHTVRSLSALLSELGRPILPSGITKIEDGSRRVDVGDLVALAIALGVNPSRLLLPADYRGDEIALTPSVRAAPDLAWLWARGEAPLLAGEMAIGHGDRPYGEIVDDFRRHALPGRVRPFADHTAVRAAEDVLERTRNLLDEREELKRDRYTEAHRQELRDRTAPALRRALARLVAEIDDLIGDDDGQRQ